MLKLRSLTVRYRRTNGVVGSDAGDVDVVLRVADGAWLAAPIAEDVRLARLVLLWPACGPRGALTPLLQVRLLGLELHCRTQGPIGDLASNKAARAALLEFCRVGSNFETATVAKVGASLIVEHAAKRALRRVLRKCQGASAHALVLVWKRRRNGWEN